MKWRSLSSECRFYIKRFLISVSFILVSIFLINIGFTLLDKFLQIGIEARMANGQSEYAKEETLIVTAIFEIVIFAIIIVFAGIDIFTKIFGIGYRGESLDIRFKKKIELKSLQRNLEGEDDK